MLVSWTSSLLRSASCALALCFGLLWAGAASAQWDQEPTGASAAQAFHPVPSDYGFRLQTGCGRTPVGGGMVQVSAADSAWIYDAKADAPVHCVDEWVVIGVRPGVQVFLGDSAPWDPRVTGEPAADALYEELLSRLDVSVSAVLHEQSERIHPVDGPSGIDAGSKICGWSRYEVSGAPMRSYHCVGYQTTSDGEHHLLGATWAFDAEAADGLSAYALSGLYSSVAAAWHAFDHSAELSVSESRGETTEGAGAGTGRSKRRHTVSGIFSMGGTFGGDWLLQVDWDDGSHETLRVASGFIMDLGLLGTPFEKGAHAIDLETTAAFTFQTIGGETDTVRYDGTARGRTISMYGLGGYRLTLGQRKMMHIKFSGGVLGALYSKYDGSGSLSGPVLKLDPAVGAAAQIEFIAWGVSLGVRYNHLKFDDSSLGAAELDGSTIGFFVRGYFGSMMFGGRR